MRHINFVARQNNTQVIIAETKFRPDLLAQARDVSQLPLPFVYNDQTGVAIELKDVWKGQEL